MPKWKVANIYIVTCVHEVEADNEEEAIRRGMDQEDDLNIMNAEYSHSELLEELEE